MQEANTKARFFTKTHNIINNSQADPTIIIVSLFEAGSFEVDLARSAALQKVCLVREFERDEWRKWRETPQFM